MSRQHGLFVAAAPFQQEQGGVLDERALLMFEQLSHDTAHGLGCRQAAGEPVDAEELPAG